MSKKYFAPLLLLLLVVAEAAMAAGTYSRTRLDQSHCDELLKFDAEIYRANRNLGQTIGFEWHSIPMTDGGDRASFFNYRIHITNDGKASFVIPNEKRADLFSSGLHILTVREMTKDAGRYVDTYAIHRDMGLIRIVGFKPSSDELEQAGLALLDVEIVRGFQERTSGAKISRTVPLNSYIISANKIAGANTASYAVNTLAPVLAQLTRDHQNLLHRSLIDGFLFLRSNKDFESVGLKVQLLKALRSSISASSETSDDLVLDLVIKNLKYQVGGVTLADPQVVQAIHNFVRLVYSEFNLDFFKLSIMAKMFSERLYFHDVLSGAKDSFSGGSYNYEIVGYFARWIYEYGISHFLTSEELDFEKSESNHPSLFESRNQLLNWLNARGEKVSLWPYLFDRESILNSVVTHEVKFEPRDTTHKFDWGHLGTNISIQWPRLKNIEVAVSRYDFAHQITAAPAQLPNGSQTSLFFQQFRRKQFAVLQRFNKHGRLSRDQSQPRGPGQYILIVSDDYNKLLHHLLRTQAAAYGYEDVLWIKPEKPITGE